MLGFTEVSILAPSLFKRKRKKLTPHLSPRSLHRQTSLPLSLSSSLDLKVGKRMDPEKTENVTEKERLSGANSEASLEKCLEENKGDKSKCKDKVEALRSSSSSSAAKPLRPLRLRSGSLTDV
ncbi:hypothetical protein GQ457_01G055420 [Hibiscus cannabinus]